MASLSALLLETKTFGAGIEPCQLEAEGDPHLGQKLEWPLGMGLNAQILESAVPWLRKSPQPFTDRWFDVAQVIKCLGLGYLTCEMG